MKFVLKFNMDSPEFQTDCQDLIVADVLIRVAQTIQNAPCETLEGPVMNLMGNIIGSFTVKQED